MSTLARVVYSPDTTPPTTPASVIATALSQTTIRITWGASSDTGGSGLAAYRVLRSTTSGGTYAQIGTDLSTASLSYDDVGLTASSTFFYRVVAVDGNGNVSSASATVNATTQASAGWADVYTTVAGADAQFTSAGRRVGIRGTTLADYAASATPGNGGSVAIISNGSFNGTENAIRIVPPHILVGANAQYVQFLSGLQVANGGARIVKQINFSMLCRYAPRYIDLASGPKWIGWTLSESAGSEINPKRLAIFEGPLTQNGITGRVFGVTYGTTQSYNEPENGFFASSGTAAEKPVFIVNGPADHSADPPRIAAGEWFHIEHVVTAPGHDAAAPNGRNRLYFRTADGVVDAYLDIALNWGADYSPLIQYFTAIEFFGGYFNLAGTQHPDNYADYCNPVIAVNMGLNSRIGPPFGYLT